MRLEYRLLGPVEAWHDGRPLRIGGPKPRALLATLLLRAGEVVSADVLVDVVWGEDPPETARALIQTYVSALRRALPEAAGQAIETRPPGYVIRPDAATVDLLRFEALAGEGRRAAEAGDHRAAARLLREALALWRGPALGGSEGRCGVRSYGWRRRGRRRWRGGSRPSWRAGGMKVSW